MYIYKNQIKYLDICLASLIARVCVFTVQTKMNSKTYLKQIYMRLSTFSRTFKDP